MAILRFPFCKKPARPRDGIADLLQGYSIEVMPRTAAKVEDFRALLPEGTRVYIAHIEGTEIADMVGTAKRLADDGFPVMPHIPARLVADRATLDDWLNRYASEAGVDQALVLAGGSREPAGDFESSMQLLETGLFDKHGMKRLHVAGHPEGNRDIDLDGSTRLVDDAATWKQAFAERTDADMAMVTQFVFEAQPVFDWIARLRAAGVTLPVHVGVAGPAKLQTLLKFAVACGVGPSLSVLQKRAKDVTRLVAPFEPTDVLADLARSRTSDIAGIHVFPLGGIKAAAEYAARVADEASGTTRQPNARP
ncbi:methylenetetrahydrofolate reductase [Citreimonas sp.]|uniref:methylenetetrahydrofolate reductase n=1 Tax=Citreimonas sp. TaxID=3036715 RepID=UPI0040591C7F